MKETQRFSAPLGTLSLEQLQQLEPQVINAAFILCNQPDSKIAQDNMYIFRDTWLRQVEILTAAVDEITTIDDFLAVSEQHILEDITKCVQALQDLDPDTLDKFAGLITGRLKRVCGVVEAEMDNYEPDPHTEQCKERAQYLRDKIMPIFSERVESIWNMIERGEVTDVDEFMMNEFIEASRMVFDGVHDVRRAVLQIRVSREVECGKVWKMVERWPKFEKMTFFEPENVLKSLETF